MYILDTGDDALTIYDITNPATPKGVGDISLSNGTQAMYVSGNYAYIIDVVSDTLEIIEISNPGNPQLITTFSLNGGTPSDIYVSGRYAYIFGTDNSDFQIIDISDPLAPSIVGSAELTSAGTGAIYVSGKYAYLAYSSNQFDVIDISNPTIPVIVSTLSIGSTPRDIYVSGRYAYVTDGGSNDLKIIDIATSTSPTTVGTIGMNGAPHGVYVSGRYAYVVDALLGLKVIDVQKPSAPTLVGSIPLTLNNTPKIAVSGRYAYIADSGVNTLNIIDLGGLETTSAIIHSLEVGNLQVRNDVIAQGQLQITGGGVFGSGGILSAGPLAISATTSRSTILGGLIIGTTTPATTSPVYEPFGNSTVVIEATSSRSVPLTIRGAGTQLSNLLQIIDANNTSYIIVDSSGQLGIGSTSPSQRLSVQGNTLISGTTSAAYFVATGSLQIGDTFYQSAGITIPDPTISSAFTIGNAPAGSTNNVGTDIVLTAGVGDGGASNPGTNL